MKKHLLSLVLIPILFTGCATSITVPVTRPAKLDMHGAESLSVLPVITSTGLNSIDKSSGVIKFFNWLYANPQEEKIANDLTNRLTTKLLNNGYFKLVAAEHVQNAILCNQKPDVDAYLNTNIADFNVTRKDHTTSRVVDGVTQYTVEYQDEVYLRIDYTIIDAETNEVLGSRYKTVTRTSNLYKPDQRRPDPYSVIYSSLDDVVDAISKDLQPYTEHKYIKLAKDKSKNPEMKTADTLAKNGQYDVARDMFIKIYEETGTFESGYNAGQILLAEMKLNEAEKIMSELVSRYGNKNAIKALADIRSEQAQLEKLRAQMEMKKSRSERAVKHETKEAFTAE